MAWQPIDTAPEDVPILVRGPAGVSLVECREGDCRVVWEGAWAYEAGVEDAYIAQATAPTEWHPIPD